MAGRITYYTYDLMAGTLLAELPATNVSWSQQVNAAGTWSGSLNLADPKVQAVNALGGTRPSRTLLIVDIDGVIVWGGVIWKRPSYDSSTRILTVSADEAWSYLDRRVQAQDYTTHPTSGAGAAYWTADPMAAEEIAAGVVADALAVAGSAFSTMTLNPVEVVANANPLTESYPLAQLQTVASIVTSLSNGGYLTGFDFAIDWAWSGLPGSSPLPTLNLTYPRRGRIAGTTGLVIDASTPGSSYVWPEDGSTQAGVIYGTAAGAGSGVATTAADPSVQSAGYPLLEAVVSYSQVQTAGGLNTAAQGDLARLEWPIVSPAVTLPMFGSTLAIGDFLSGDDARVIIDSDERFPNGLDAYLRILGVAANPADVGQSMMTLTLGLPPALAPVAQPPA